MGLARPEAPTQSGHAAAVAARWACQLGPIADDSPAGRTPRPGADVDARGGSEAGPCEGSCLSESCSPRCVELLLEAVAAALPPVVVALDPRQLLAQPFDLSFLFPNAGIAGILLGRRPLRSHHALMAYPPRELRTYLFLDLAG